MNISFGTKVTPTAQNAILKKVDDGKLTTKRDYNNIEDICVYKHALKDEPILDYEEHDGFLEDYDSDFEGAFFLERPGYKTTKFLSENVPTLTKIKRAEENLFIEKVNSMKNVIRNSIIAKNSETAPFYDELLKRLDIGIKTNQASLLKEEQKAEQKVNQENKKLDEPMPNLREKVQQLFAKAPIDSNPDHEYFEKMFK